MNIEKIRVRNFKCYDELEVQLSKITLLTGANSSGKSSFLYSILSAVQSREFPFQFSPNGKYVNMGDFTEIVHSHKRENVITLEFEYQNDSDCREKISTTWVVDKVRELPVLQSLLATTDYYTLKLEKVRKYDLSFEYFIDKDPNREFRSPKMYSKILESIDNIIKEVSKQENVDVQEKQNRTLSKISKFSHVKRKIDFKFENISELNATIREKGNFYLESIIQGISRVFNRYDDNINYISSFRLFPERTYYETSKVDLKVGKFGENYEDQIIAWETSKSPKYKKLCDILKELGLLEEIKSKRMTGGRYEILVKNKKNGVWSSITDVGFGISQFLPIIVADLQLSKGSTLFIAQPEIHLHPKIQAHFADYIVSSIKRENKYYIIETHSEYLINRLRLAICEEKILEDEISCLYIENNGSSAKKYQISLLKSGQIKNAPASFFDTYMLDVMNIAIKAQ
ncbi:DUF3696 domain-containing protein [Pedobacter nanyangensis]|uniref:DUF3696 domain-containing protein n=1 Tax=Pedobacter nanyangensis TaxID=1562389 RepID=UPI000DE47377|nr:AAA family ATPase [Pedobacter nanyangensis]